MPLSTIERMAPNWFTLSSEMLDMGADGIGGALSGTCRFIAPVKSRIRAVAISAQGAAVAAANGIRVDGAAGVVSDDQDQRSMEMPATAALNSGFLCQGFDDRNNLFEAGQAFRVKSDGQSGAGIRASVTVVLEPVGPVGWAGSLFCLSGEFPLGAAALTNNYPSLPGGYEVIQAWCCLAATIAAQANTIVVTKNAASTIGTLNMGAGGEDLTVFTDATMHVSANRFVKQEDFLQMNLTPGGANFTSEIAYTILCRRLL